MSTVCFNVYLSFIKTMEVVIKQMGTLLAQHLPLLSAILVKGVLRLSSIFIKSVKDAKIEDTKEENIEMEDEEADETEAAE